METRYAVFEAAAKVSPLTNLPRYELVACLDDKCALLDHYRLSAGHMVLDMSTSDYRDISDLNDREMAAWNALPLSVRLGMEVAA